MWSLLTGGLSSIISGVLAPWFSYLDKKQDVTLDGFKTATGADEKAYEAYLAYRTQAEAARIAETSWWGPKACLMMVAVPACLHVALVFLDSSFTFWTGHYGVMGIPPLPGVYADFEQRVVEFLFGAAILGAPASAAAAWLHRS